CRKAPRGSVCHEEIDLETKQLGSQAWESIVTLVGPAEFDDDILAFDVTEVTKPQPERLDPARPAVRGGRARGSYPREVRRLQRIVREWAHEYAETEKDHDNGPRQVHLIARARAGLQPASLGMHNDSAFSRTGPQTLALSCDCLPGVGCNA